MNSAVLGHPASFPALSLPDVRGNWHIGGAVLVSLLIHGVALGWLPGLSGRTEAPELHPVQVRFAPPPPERPPVAVSPAPTFVPPAQTARRAPEPVPQREVPILVRPMAESGAEAPVIRREAAPPAAPVETPRASQPAVVPRAASVDAGVLAAYGRELAGAVATRQRYPRVALMRQWQGTAVLQLELAADGRLLGVRVISSSGHDTLDRQALDMVREAVPLPSLPEALAGRPLTVDVPVVFRIAS
jgi:protein TonB